MKLTSDQLRSVGVEDGNLLLELVDVFAAAKLEPQWLGKMSIVEVFAGNAPRGPIRFHHFRAGEDESACRNYTRALCCVGLSEQTERCPRCLEAIAAETKALKK